MAVSAGEAQVGGVGIAGHEDGGVRVAGGRGDDGGQDLVGCVGGNGDDERGDALVAGTATWPVAAGAVAARRAPPEPGEHGVGVDGPGRSRGADLDGEQLEDAGAGTAAEGGDDRVGVAGRLARLADHGEQSERGQVQPQRPARCGPELDEGGPDVAIGGGEGEVGRHRFPDPSGWTGLPGGWCGAGRPVPEHLDEGRAEVHREGGGAGGGRLAGEAGQAGRERVGGVARRGDVGRLAAVADGAGDDDE